MSMTGRDRATGSDASNSNNIADEALSLMEQAIALLDAHGAPPDVGAHLDLAIHRLKNWIADARA